MPSRRAHYTHTDIVNHGCFISTTKLSIAVDMGKIISKDVAKNNNVSPNTVERVIDSYYDSNTVENYLFETYHLMSSSR